MKVLHAIGTIMPDSGGPARSSQGLVACLNRAGVDTYLLSLTPGDRTWVDGVRNFRCASRSGYFTARETLNFAVSGIGPELLHAHCLWGLSTHLVSSLARNMRIPYVVAPRGMLEPWSLDAKKWKKRLAMWLYQRRDLMTASALHATAESEAEQFRRLGFKQPVIISPNGVEFPHVMPPRNRREDGKKTALFLSRIHPKKGLMELVEAWAEVKEQSAVGSRQSAIGSCQTNARMNFRTSELLNWHFEYAGPDFNGHLSEVKRRMRELGVVDDFTYLGNLDDTQKWAAYRRADLFILPTYSENFGIVIAEALAAGVPVLTTTGTPWKSLIDNMCGWWIEPGLDSLVKALPEVMLTSRVQLIEMGERGRLYANRMFSWDSIAAEMKQAYEWMLVGGPPPPCIRL